MTDTLLLFSIDLRLCHDARYLELIVKTGGGKNQVKEDAENEVYFVVVHGPPRCFSAHQQQRGQVILLTFLVLLIL